MEEKLNNFVILKYDNQIKDLINVLYRRKDPLEELIHKMENGKGIRKKIFPR